MWLTGSENSDAVRRFYIKGRLFRKLSHVTLLFSTHLVLQGTEKTLSATIVLAELEYIL